MTKKFDEWIRKLNEDVIQSEYGYEPGEFTVYPDLWRREFDAGLTPSQAFQGALDELADLRRKEDEDRDRNWARIQAADALSSSKS